MSLSPASALAASAASPSDHQRRNLTLLAAFLGWMFDGLEMGIFPLVARPALQEMAGQMSGGAGVAADVFVGLWMGRITAAFLVGAAAGGLVFGWLGDKVGRVRAMSLAILCYSLFTGLAYVAQTPMHLGVLRFLAALGMGGEWSLGVALVMEVWPDKHRPMLAGVIGAAANLGFALVATLGMFLPVTQHTWRWILLIGAAPAVLTFFIRLFVPESESWQRAAAAGPAHPVREMFSPGLRRVSVVAILIASVVLIGMWASVQWLPLWADQMAGAAAPKAKAYTQAASAIGSVVGCLLGAWLGQRLGRRAAYFTICLGSLVCCEGLFLGISSYDTTFLWLTFAVGTLVGAFFGWLPLYLPELFPTRIRATAQGLAYNIGRLFAAAGALQMGALMAAFDGSYARAGAVLSLIYAVGLVIIWAGPETKGRPLPA